MAMYGGAGGYAGFGRVGYGEAGFNSPYLSTPPKFTDISYDTSSNDPILVHARVFVGNLNTNQIERDDLLGAFWRFGRIIGCTLFKSKGYAFIQYSTEAEARQAVTSSKGAPFAGQALDVKMACEGKNIGVKVGANGGVQKGVVGLKRARDDMTSGGGSGQQQITRLVPSAPQTFIDTTPQDAFQNCPTSDVMVCGNCQRVFREWVPFRDHRKCVCKPGPSRPESEPEKVKCFVCKEDFDHSWGLLKHLSSLHNLTVFVDAENPESAKNGGTTVKAVSEALVKKD